ncbi:MAG: hypothetical protein AB1810_06075 [Pseudomonadota bacterium]
MKHALLMVLALTQFCVPAVYAKEPQQPDSQARSASGSEAVRPGSESGVERSAELNGLNAKITELSSKIINEQTMLADRVQKLIDQRRGLAALEGQLAKDVLDQERQLSAQRASLDQMQKQLDEHKKTLSEQQSRLEEVKAHIALQDSQRSAAPVAANSAAKK